MTVAVFVLLLFALGSVVLAALALRAAARARAELTDLEGLDPLTGLPNRAVFERDLAAAVESAGAGRRRFTVLLFELNRFAAINETYGHETGDALLDAVISQIRPAVGSRTVYRYSGPQFAVIYPDLGSIEGARSKADELQAALQRPFAVARDSIRLTTSVGFTVTDAGSADWQEVLLDAVIALQEATDRGPGSVVSYEVSLRSKMNPITAERRLREALEKGQFWLLYMPVVSLWDNSIVGVEALLRWADPDRGLISPNEFLKALDDTGLIVPVGEWVLGEACRQAKVWLDAFPERDLTTTINVSPRQLAQDDFAETLGRAIREHEIDAEHLCLEITGLNSTRDVESAWSSLRRVKQLGVQLALDDFGTGYASLAYMRNFQIDVLKIEPSFVQALGSSREDEAIVQQIVGLAHNLGITAVAEGVDAPIQAETLKALTCDLAQGYYFSVPQPVDVMDKLLARGKVIPGESTRKSVDWSGGGVPVARDLLQG